VIIRVHWKLADVLDSPNHFIEDLKQFAGFGNEYDNLGSPSIRQNTHKDFIIEWNDAILTMVNRRK
jgi:hypothetical protein